VQPVGHTGTFDVVGVTAGVARSLDARISMRCAGEHGVQLGSVLVPAATESSRAVFRTTAARAGTRVECDAVLATNAGAEISRSSARVRIPIPPAPVGLYALVAGGSALAAAGLALGAVLLVTSETHAHLGAPSIVVTP
jgi:hypothetical protein